MECRISNIISSGHSMVWSSIIVLSEADIMSLCQSLDTHVSMSSLRTINMSSGSHRQRTPCNKLTEVWGCNKFSGHFVFSVTKMFSHVSATISSKGEKMLAACLAHFSLQREELNYWLTRSHSNIVHSLSLIHGLSNIFYIYTIFRVAFM